MTPAAYLKQTRDERQRDLFEFLRFPSISARSEHRKDVAACARWLTKHLKGIGFKTRVIPTKGHPVVLGEFKAGARAPTVLYYGHYDVQPVDPENLWDSPPFEPVLRGGAICARGASDDKGQLFAQIKGLEAVLKTTGTLPVNVIILAEGEEECQSKNLPAFIRANKKRLKADIAVVSDTAQFSKKTPAVTFGLRGIAAAEVFVYGPSHDLHSGSFGGAVANPVNVLCTLVARLHNDRGTVTIPGFYRRIKKMSAWERARLAELPFSEAAYKKAVGVPALHGEKGYTTHERSWSRPTLDVNGITGGYQGEGAKTIIPSMASCKITMRLVPDMEPRETCDLLEHYLKKLAPPTVRLKVKKLGGAKGVIVPTDGPWLEAAAQAVKKGFGVCPVFTKEGGSIPIVVDFKEMLGLDTLLSWFGQHDDRIHSPNERFRVRDFENGCKTAAALPDELAKTKG